MPKKLLWEKPVDPVSSQNSDSRTVFGKELPITPRTATYRKQLEIGKKKSSYQVHIFSPDRSELGNNSHPASEFDH
jgi:hypothetical protein